MQPDGRPLYAYRWNDGYYERLKTEIRDQMPDALAGQEDNCFASMFCVYAAETFRRRHESGPWAWQTVFAEVGQDTPGNLQLVYGWVERGLCRFERPLLRSRAGHREFLITLACEGGLPLRLLHNENAKLNRYFRELLTACHRERRSTEYDAKKTARQVAVRYLPAFLRHEVVFELSGTLIDSIIRLQEQVGDAADPIASLDAQEPKWRRDLPLPVEDDTVEALLKNLVGQARDLALTERQRWRWRCFLVQRGEHWGIEQHLELPSVVSRASLQEWSCWDELGARLRVLLQTTEGIAPIALLTRIRGIDDQATYQCEGLRPNGIRLAGRLAEAGCRLLLSQGNEETELPMVGGEELGPLPWVFVERDSRWEMCGEGSVRRPEESARMLVSNGGDYRADDGTCELVGEAPDLERSLYRVTGTTEWRHLELGNCQIRCASQEASEERFLLHGGKLSSVLNLAPPFLGMPSLHAVGRDETRRRIDDGSLEWRPVNAPESDWHQNGPACAGKVWIRYRDANGALRFRRQVEVAPLTTRAEVVRVGTSVGEAGVIRLTGLPRVRVIVPEIAGCQFRMRPVDDGVEIECLSQGGVETVQFNAILQWPDGRELTLTLPFPHTGAAFIRAGEVLPPMERVALGRLAAIQAIVRTPAIGGRFHIEARLSTSAPVHNPQELRESIRTAANEPTRFNLLPNPGTNCLDARDDW